MDIKTDSGYALLTQDKSDFAVEIQSDGTYTYIAYAECGSLLSAPVWKVKRVDTATGSTTWAEGNSRNDKIATDLTTLTYL
jgi:hypothetical protein